MLAVGWARDDTRPYRLDYNIRVGMTNPSPKIDALVAALTTTPFTLLAEDLVLKRQSADSLEVRPNIAALLDSVMLHVAGIANEHGLTAISHVTTDLIYGPEREAYRDHHVDITAR